MTATRRTSLGRVAHWRLQPEFWDRDVRVRVPALNPDMGMDNLIYPPCEGRLPAYELLIDTTEEKTMFKDWVTTLSAEDQEKIRQALTLERFTP